MRRVKIEVTLVSDEESEEEHQLRFEIEEEIPGGMGDLDRWEEAVRRIGYRMMRALFRSGVGLLEQEVLRGYVHRDGGCSAVKRGKLGYEVKTVFGRVKLRRQRVYCKTCREWVTPINGVLGLDKEGRGRATRGLVELSSQCAVHQPYRLAHQQVGALTQDPYVLSMKQLHLIVGREGARVREGEEEERKQVAFDVVREIQDRQVGVKDREGRLYICLDGILVRSAEGKGRWREGKVGLVCTEDRESVGKKGRQTIPEKRYISSFETSAVFGSRVYAEAV